MNAKKEITVREAVVMATEKFRGAFDEKGEVTLEEVEPTSDTWRITLGFYRNRPVPSILKAVAEIAGDYNTYKVYKVVTLDKYGKFLSVKNRD